MIVIVCVCVCVCVCVRKEILNSLAVDGGAEGDIDEGAQALVKVHKSISKLKAKRAELLKLTGNSRSDAQLDSNTILTTEPQFRSLKHSEPSDKGGPSQVSDFDDPFFTCPSSQSLPPTPHTSFPSALNPTTASDLTQAAEALRGYNSPPTLLPSPLSSSSSLSTISDSFFNDQLPPQLTNTSLSALQPTNSSTSPPRQANVSRVSPRKVNLSAGGETGERVAHVAPSLLSRNTRHEEKVGEREEEFSDFWNQTPNPRSELESAPPPPQPAGRWSSVRKRSVERTASPVKGRRASENNFTFTLDRNGPVYDACRDANPRPPLSNGSAGGAARQERARQGPVCKPAGLQRVQYRPGGSEVCPPPGVQMVSGHTGQYSWSTGQPRQTGRSTGQTRRGGQSTGQTRQVVWSTASISLNRGEYSLYPHRRGRRGNSGSGGYSGGRSNQFGSSSTSFGQQSNTKSILGVRPATGAASPLPAKKDAVDYSSSMAPPSPSLSPGFGKKLDPQSQISAHRDRGREERAATVKQDHNFTLDLSCEMWDLGSDEKEAGEGGSMVRGVKGEEDGVGCNGASENHGLVITSDKEETGEGGAVGSREDGALGSPGDRENGEGGAVGSPGDRENGESGAVGSPGDRENGESGALRSPGDRENGEGGALGSPGDRENGEGGAPGDEENDEVGWEGALEDERANDEVSSAVQVDGENGLEDDGSSESLVGPVASDKEETGESGAIVSPGDNGGEVDGESGLEDEREAEEVGDAAELKESPANSSPRGEDGELADSTNENGGTEAELNGSPKISSEQVAGRVEPKQNTISIEEALGSVEVEQNCAAEISSEEAGGVEVERNCAAEISSEEAGGIEVERNCAAEISSEEAGGVEVEQNCAAEISSEEAGGVEVEQNCAAKISSEEAGGIEVEQNCAAEISSEEAGGVEVEQNCAAKISSEEAGGIEVEQNCAAEISSEEAGGIEVEQNCAAEISSEEAGGIEVERNCAAEISSEEAGGIEVEQNCAAEISSEEAGGIEVEQNCAAEISSEEAGGVEVEQNCAAEISSEEAGGVEVEQNCAAEISSEEAGGVEVEQNCAAEISSEEAGGIEVERNCAAKISSEEVADEFENSEEAGQEVPTRDVTVVEGQGIEGTGAGGSQNEDEGTSAQETEVMEEESRKGKGDEVAGMEEARDAMECTVGGCEEVSVSGAEDTGSVLEAREDNMVPLCVVEEVSVVEVREDCVEVNLAVKGVVEPVSVVEVPVEVREECEVVKMADTGVQSALSGLEEWCREMEQKGNVERSTESSEMCASNTNAATREDSALLVDLGESEVSGGSGGRENTDSETNGGATIRPWCLLDGAASQGSHSERDVWPLNIKASDSHKESAPVAPETSRGEYEAQVATYDPRKIVEKGVTPYVAPPKAAGFSCTVEANRETKGPQNGVRHLTTSPPHASSLLSKYPASVTLPAGLEAPPQSNPVSPSSSSPLKLAEEFVPTFPHSTPLPAIPASFSSSTRSSSPSESLASDSSPLSLPLISPPSPSLPLITAYLPEYPQYAPNIPGLSISSPFYRPRAVEWSSRRLIGLGRGTPENNPRAFILPGYPECQPYRPEPIHYDPTFCVPGPPFCPGTW